MDGGIMKKLCARCGIIFDGVDASSKFCSQKCEKIMKESSLGYVKKSQNTQRTVYAPEM